MNSLINGITTKKTRNVLKKEMDKIVRKYEKKIDNNDIVNSPFKFALCRKRSVFV